MFNGNGGYSLADIAAVTEGGNSRNGNGAWGDEWWIILLFLFAFNGNGFGGFGGGRQGSGAADNYVLASDFASIERKLDSITNGLADGFYAANTNTLTGFSTLQNNITGEFRNVDNAVCTLGYNTQAGFNASNLANMQNTNAIISQLTTMAAADAACCCETQRLIERNFADTGYRMATEACETRRAIADSTRDIIEGQNNSTRAILDFLTQDKIATLTAENQGLKLKASQEAQNNYLVSALRPCPIPAYTVPNPYCCTPTCGTGYGFAGIY